MPELALARRGAACAAVVSVPAVVVAALVRGGPGMRGAAVAAGLVTGLFALTGGFLACVARWSPATLPAVSLVGAVLRMVAYGVLLTALDEVDGIDRASTLVATCLLLIATLTYDVRFAATAPGFYWLHSLAPHDAHAKERTQG
jgi:hypothetical protein